MDAITVFWPLVGLAVGSGIESARATRRGERAWHAHHDAPSNPTHLARYNAFVSRSAAASASAVACIAGAAVILAMGKPVAPAWWPW